ncbi:MAG: sigma-70 family RNA polymerase sigma factor [Verrucomicrobiales bacterium]|nr:sigma-70 family RNA polymerase sigma factor [Verrucomicrobiales bacterium]
MAAEHPSPEIEQRLLGEYVNRAKDGDAKAWKDICHYFERPLTVFIARMDWSLSPAEANEMCHDCLQEAWRGLGKKADAIPFKSWLFSLTRHSVIDEVRKRTAQRRSAPGGALESIDAVAETGESVVQPVDARPSPDQAVIHREEGKLLHEALEELGDGGMDCRRIIDLFYFGGLKYEEIGGELTLAAKTVSTRLVRCKQRLGAILRSKFSGSKTALLSH